MNNINKVVLAYLAKLSICLLFICIYLNVFSCGGNEAESERVRDTHKKAFSFYQNEKYAEAESLLVESRALQSNSVEVQQLLGLIRVAQIKDAEAVPYFRTALRIDRKHADVWLALIQAELRLGNLDEALQAVEKASKLYPNSARFIYEHGQIFAKTAKADSILELYEELAEKTRDLDLDQRVADLNPESADAHYNLARAHERMKDYPAAIKEYQKALKLNSEFPQLPIIWGSSIFDLISLMKRERLLSMPFPGRISRRNTTLISAQPMPVLGL